VNAVVFDVALTAYILAALAAVAALPGRRPGLLSAAAVLTRAGWVCHTVALLLRWIELGRLPLLSLPEMVSVAIWAAVLFQLWAERHYRAPVLVAFVLPVVLVLGLALPSGLRALVFERPRGGGWVWVHVVLALIGLAALVLNFAGALMYLLQERQIKRRRPGAFFYLLPPLESLDRLTLLALIVGFPFFTAALILGVVGAPRAWGGLVAFDPLALLSIATWVVYAVTLSGRAVGHWHGRRAAYFAIAGFGVLLLTLGAGALAQGRHGS
jgi:ABC-type transport system involved in cytochrome c biogenesis permease subunit